MARPFGEVLREIREQRGLTQAALADLAGLNPRALSHWEQGLREPAWGSIQVLCDALNVSCEVFRSAPGTVPPAKKRKPGRPQKPKGK
jgi:transcriptional regulator with XRE-family HTH domain